MTSLNTSKRPAGLRGLPLAEGPRVRGCCAELAPAVIAPADQARVVWDLEVLANPIRFQLLAVLASNPGRVCVCDLEAIVPVKQPTVSHHLRLLREAGLVDSERDGVWAYYRVREGALRALSARVGGALNRLSGEEELDR
jgi:ArsR family transcriptional regulator